MTNAFPIEKRAHCQVPLDDHTSEKQTPHFSMHMVGVWPEDTTEIVRSSSSRHRRNRFVKDTVI